MWRKGLEAGFGQGLHIADRDTVFILIFIFEDATHPAVFTQIPHNLRILQTGTLMFGDCLNLLTGTDGRAPIQAYCP